MTNELARVIARADEHDVIMLEGEYRLGLEDSDGYFVGKDYAQNLLKITTPNLVIDGSAAKIIVELDGAIHTDVNIIFIASTARNVTVKNLNLSVTAKSEAASKRITGIYSTAQSLRLKDCRVEMFSQNQTSMTALCNNGDLDTHLDTRADGLSVTGCHLSAIIEPDCFDHDSIACGICNRYANSVSVQNNFIFAKNRGKGEEQRAIGIETSGRFGRFIGNNVKANGSHNHGKRLDQAGATGFINEGLYTLIASNNIVGEWGGRCVGLENRERFAKVNGNKVLSTHTIKGRSVLNRGDDGIFDGNLIISTSRNVRLIDHAGSDCIISNNHMEAVFEWREYESTCGVYASYERARGNLITNNVVKNICDCALFLTRDVGVVENNLITTYPDWNDLIKIAYADDRRLAVKLDESSVRSLPDLN